MSNSLDIVEQVKEKQDISEPPMYNVILINDDYTPMDFVVNILINVFRKSEAEAFHLMLDVHQNGAGLAGTYQKEIAIAKQTKVIEMAQKEEHPLQCVVEAEKRTPKHSNFKP